MNLLIDVLLISSIVGSRGQYVQKMFDVYVVFEQKADQAVSMWQTFLELWNKASSEDVEQCDVLTQIIQESNEPFADALAFCSPRVESTEVFELTFDPSRLKNVTDTETDFTQTRKNVGRQVIDFLFRNKSTEFKLSTVGDISMPYEFSRFILSFSVSLRNRRNGAKEIDESDEAAILEGLHLLGKKVVETLTEETSDGAFVETIRATSLNVSEAKSQLTIHILNSEVDHEACDSFEGCEEWLTEEWPNNRRFNIGAYRYTFSGLVIPNEPVNFNDDEDDDEDEESHED